MNPSGAPIATSPPESSVPRSLARIAERLRACMQCGTCTASCPNSDSMDHTPRELWRMTQLGLSREIFRSRTFWLCSTCFTCTLRCPRGLPLTEVMGELKRAAVSEGLFTDRKSPVFYRVFLDTVRRYGRVREMELMARYFLSLGNPLVPFGFTPLGVKLLVKGKLSLQMPSFSSRGRLDALYRKVKELEARE